MVWSGKNLLTYISFSPEETLQLGRLLGKKLKGGEVIALKGDLGAGKTLFVKGLAQGLDAHEPVTSPTFNLIHLYQGRLLLAHFDVYRLPSPQALEELGYEEFFYGMGVTAVEWSDLIESYLPEEYLAVQINRSYSRDKGEHRMITIIPYGKKIEALAEELKKDVCTGY